ncbi:MAG: hypothetical protein B7O98_05615 [Zestosphaera tikiterensis]|uniref:DNA-directed RNA polymerase II subunit RPB9-like zinc ribbon domain-containing protein n=1 Tax=Zestosphaera tikiterensis TaxID=1973259 RepID=A0A2R7Y434_9CREN|nr:MAG: hypothetical protein B7O98_05615 [Zestosphaera tikiterensis]
MKFCPKDGSMLVPSKEGDEVVLVCPRCGYKEKTNQKEVKGYKLESKTDTNRRIKTTSVVSSEGQAIRRNEELEQEKEDYYEIFLDLMSEEEGG